MSKNKFIEKIVSRNESMKRDLEVLAEDENFKDYLMELFVPIFYNNPDTKHTKQCISTLSLLEGYIVNWCENTERNLESTATFSCEFLGETFPTRYISRIGTVQLFSEDLNKHKWVPIDVLESLSISIYEDDTILVMTYEPEPFINNLKIEINGTIEVYNSPREFFFRAIEEIKKL